MVKYAAQKKEKKKFLHVLFLWTSSRPANSYRNNNKWQQMKERKMKSR